MNDFKKKLIVEIALTVFVFFVLLGGILFFRKNVIFYRDNIVRERKNMENLNYKISLLYKLQNQYKEIEPYFDKLNSLFPSYYDLINFNKDLQSLAARHKLSFSFSFAGENVKKEGGIGYVNFNTTLGSDNLEDLLNFLKDLETFRYSNVIENISFTTQRDDVISFSIRGKVFYKE